MKRRLLGGTVNVATELVADDEGVVRRQLTEYAEGTRREFDLAIEIPDSFTGAVMAAMREIEFGTTVTYAELAARLETAPIAVGTACGRNPLPVLVPCHRVIRSDGSLGGYSAPGGVSLKRRLLLHERQHAGSRRGTPG